MRQRAAKPERGQPDGERVGKAGGGLRPRAARAEAAQRVCSMAGIGPRMLAAPHRCRTVAPSTLAAQNG